jgi:hypothetical protein
MPRQAAAKDERRLVQTATPGIYKRGKSYVVVFRDHRGRQRKRIAATLAEARDVKAGCISDVKRGAFRAVSTITFAEYARHWISSYTGRTRREIGERTLAMYRAESRPHLRRRPRPESVRWHFSVGLADSDRPR